MERWKVKHIIQIIVFLLIANIPFITATHLMGLDIFLDSFEHPTAYQFVKTSQINIQTPLLREDYTILQKASHPTFSIKKNDIIIYFDQNGDLICNKIYQINTDQYHTKYYLIDENNNINNQPIFKNQIMFKVINNINNNILTGLSVKTWDLSINNLNLNAIIFGQ